MDRRLTRLTAVFLSNGFFYVWLSCFAIACTWIAIASLYPMAFDEEFHYGLIKIYAASWSPYGIQHTSDMAQYGPATADASYLFHYLMSFPYRVLAAVGLSDTSIIVLLRLLNLGFVVASVVMFRRALIASGMSRAVTNVGLAMFMLIPSLIMLASQINYDTLLFLVVAWCFSLVVAITGRLLHKHELALKDLWFLLIALLIGMSIKYAFLPIAAAIISWILILLAMAWQREHVTIASIPKCIRSQWSTMSRRLKAGLVALSTISIFFAAHYVVNAVNYGSPIPSCDQVFTKLECRAYGPWNRNQNYIADRPDNFMPLSFPAYMAQEWFPGMTERLTFAVAGKTNGFQTKVPLPIVIYGFVILTVIGTVFLVLQIIRREAPWLTWFTLFSVMVYSGVLSWQLYGDYVETARPVAINGRYLLLLLPLVGVVLIHAIRQQLQRLPSQWLALGTAITLLLFLIGGGGASTYIIQSESQWYWPGFGQDSHVVIQRVTTSLTLPMRFD